MQILINFFLFFYFSFFNLNLLSPISQIIDILHILSISNIQTTSINSNISINNNNNNNISNINILNAKTKDTKDTLVIGITQEFENLNPLVHEMLATSYLYGFVGRALVTVNANNKYIPQAVEKIPTMENKLANFITVGKQKKIKAIWTIRKKLVWGDGVPVTCEDLIFTKKVAASKNVSIGEKETYEQIEKITFDPKKPKQCTFIYKKAKWDFNRLATFYILPKHLEEPIFNKYNKTKEAYEQNSNYTTNPTNKGLYFGPYVISDLKLGSHVTFIRNPLFYGSSAKIKKIILKLIPNTSTLESNLRSGNIDMISVLGLSFDQAINFQKKIKSDNLSYKVNFKDSYVYEHIDLNLKQNILQNKKLRKALVYAIDRKKLSNALFNNKQKPAIHNLPLHDPWFTDDPDKIVIYEYSPKKANDILEEIAWKKQSDGYRYKDGEKLSLTLMSTSGNKIRELVQVFLKDQWKKVGIEINIKNEPARIFFSETTRKGKYPHMALYSWISAPESNPRSTLHIDSIPSEKNTYSGQNYSFWKNKNVSNLIDLIDIEFNPKKRRQYMHKILYYYTDEVPVIPLYYRANISVIPKNLKGYELTPHQFPASIHVENWHY